MSISNVALVTGVTGVAGLALARHLVGSNTLMKWDKVYGLSRKPTKYVPQSVTHVPCDLVDETQSRSTLKNLTDVTHIYHAMFSHHDKEEDNLKHNTGALRNLLDHSTGPIQHVALITGTRYYLGPFEIWPFLTSEVETPCKERMPRLQSWPDFYYYKSEDLLADRAKKMSFKWSVARPFGIMGICPGNTINIAGHLAIYATICKELKMPFRFPGSLASYDYFIDVTDADILAQHMEWEAATASGKNQAFNVVNGDVFRWRFMWPVIAEYFNVEPEGPGEQLIDFELFVKENAEVWDKIVKKNDLKSYPLSDVLRPWIANAIVNMPCSVVNDMNKSREAGFLTYQNSEKTFIKVFDMMKGLKLIPSF